jgi:hypothetical protein
MVLVLSRGGFCPKDRRQADGDMSRFTRFEEAAPDAFAQFAPDDM